MPRKITRDHAKKTQRPMVEDRVIAEQKSALLTSAIKSQSRFFRELGLRERTLTLPLPLMVAAVLTLLWRDVRPCDRIGSITRSRRILMV